MAEIATKDRILDAAEKLFAEKGFAATSLRAIIKEAGVNTAAVHYHFGSREGLVEAVLRRRAGPINDERLRRLDELESRTALAPPPLASIVETFIAPTVLAFFDERTQTRYFPHCVVRAISEPDDRIRSIIRDVFREVSSRYSAAFSRALPGLSPEEVHWRMHFMIGAMAFTVAVPRVGAGAGAPPDEDARALIERLVAFVEAGMRAGTRRATEGNPQ